MSGIRDRGTAMSSEILCGLERTQRGRNHPAGRPELLALGLVLGHEDLPGAVLLADFAEPGELGEQALLHVAVHLGDHGRAGARREVEAPAIHGLERHVVDQLERAREDARREHGGDGARGGVHRVEDDQRRLHVPGLGDELER